MGLTFFSASSFQPHFSRRSSTSGVLRPVFWFVCGARRRAEKRGAGRVGESARGATHAERWRGGGAHLLDEQLVRLHLVVAELGLAVDLAICAAGRGSV